MYCNIKGVYSQNLSTRRGNQTSEKMVFQKQGLYLFGHSDHSERMVSAAVDEHRPAQEIFNDPGL